MPNEQEIAEFWRDGEYWCARTGRSEEEMLERFPSFRGTKPATKLAPPMPAIRDGRMAAANDDF
jgi:hypothetical protein